MASAYSHFLSQNNHSSASGLTKGLLRRSDMRSPVLGSRNTSGTTEPGQNGRLRKPGNTVSKLLKGLRADEFKSYLSGVKNISGLQQIRDPQHGKRQHRDSVDFEKWMEDEESLDVKSGENNEDANYFLKPTNIETSGVTIVLHKPEKKSVTSNEKGTAKIQKLILKGDSADTKGITLINQSHVRKTTSGGRVTASTSNKGAYREKDVAETSEVESSILDSSSSSPELRQHFYTISQLDTDVSLTPKIRNSEEMVVDKQLSDDQELEVHKSGSRDGHPLCLPTTTPALIHSTSDFDGPTRMIASEKTFQFSAKCHLDEGEDLDYPSSSSNIHIDSQSSVLLSSLEKKSTDVHDHEEDSTDIEESIFEESILEESILEEVSKESSVISTEEDADIQESILEEILERSSLITTDKSTDIPENSMKTTSTESSAVDTKYHHPDILEGSSAYTLHGESNFESENDKTCDVAKMSDSGMSPEVTPSYSLDFSNGNESKETASSFAGRKQEQPRDPPMANAGTQTHTDDPSRFLNSHSWSYPTVSGRPHQYGGQYLDPSPVEGLLTYTPNMLALNDMILSQLRLTRQLLEIHRSLLTSLNSSLRQDYHYTTLQDTRHFIKTHKPKVLTFNEAKRKCTQKRDS